MAFNRGFYCSKLIGMLFKPTLISTELNRFKEMSLLNLNKLGTVTCMSINFMSNARSRAWFHLKLWVSVLFNFQIPDQLKFLFKKLKY